MVALHNGRTDSLEVSPNLWAGIGLVRGGAGTALVGSHEEVAERIAEYHDLGIDEFILSGYPHLEEAYEVGEGVIPVLRRRGLMPTEIHAREALEADQRVDGSNCWALRSRSCAGGRMTVTSIAPRLIASDEEAIRAARQFAELIAQDVIERDRAGSLPVTELAELDASGLLAITVAALPWRRRCVNGTLAEVIRTIASVDPAIAQAPQGHFLMVDVLAVFGTEDQRQMLFGEVLAGGRLGNALAERGGRDAQDLRTRLRAGRRLDGRKYYCTGALTSRWIGVSALDDRDQLVLAFVPRDTPGVPLDEDWNVMGQRATVSGSATFVDVEVDPELVVPYYQVFEEPQQLGARAQLVHAAIQVGIAGGALRDARDFVRTRARPFFEAARAGWAATAGEDPYTIGRYGRLATRVRAAETLLAAAAATQQEIGRRPRDRQPRRAVRSRSRRPRHSRSEVAVEVASDLFALTGASAADERYDLSRHWRNARTHASHDPVDWKYHHVGNFLLNDALPPNHAQL